MKLGKFLAAPAGLALTFGVAGQALAADAGPIKIGVYLPLTGQNAFGGQLELEGVRLAHREMPKVLDRPVELVVVDNKSDGVRSRQRRQAPCGTRQGRVHRSLRFFAGHGWRRSG